MNMPHNDTLRDSVLSEIHDKKITMRPYWQYLLKTALGIVGMALLILFLIFIVSFIFFMLHQSGAIFAPDLGLFGVRILLLSLPWILILISLIFLVLLEILVQRYSFVYRRPVVYSIFLLILVVTSSGFVVAQTSFHQGLFERADRHQLPIGEKLYKEVGSPQLRTVYPGRIREFNSDGFYLETSRREILDVDTNAQTRFINGDDLDIHDIVIVFGQRQQNYIQAQGVRKISPRERSPFIPRIEIER